METDNGELKTEYGSIAGDWVILTDAKETIVVASERVTKNKLGNV